ncbi:MAG: hypothetical protein MJZ84_08180 [Paludibacteraceae bacterium]|nr:hypothetical protein [Paludibacteraceae bacterium]
MKRYLFVVLMWGLLCPTMAQPKVTLEQLQQDWSRYQGQRVTITTPLILCGKLYDSHLVSPERLFAPEERAVGLGQGDSTTYWYWRHYNDSLRIKLQCRTGFNLNLGATVKNLTAQVIGPRSLQTGAQPRFKNYKPSKKITTQKGALTICAANVQNYFVHVGGYATKRNTPAQHQWQCEKTAAALTRINADIYALCELEQGSSAPAELCARMNSLCRKDKYTFVVTDTVDRDTISVGFIYNKARVRPHGDLIYVYNENLNNIYAHRFMIQSFEDMATGQSFYMSINHPRSKRGDAAQANAKRVNSIKRVLTALDTIDAPIILVGDYNSYGQEQSLQMLVHAGYKDMVMAMDSLNYSYSYNGECGYLDRVFANDEMQPYITSIQPIHWNTDYYYSAAYWSKYNYKNNIPPKQKQANIWKHVSPQAKRNLLFRYSDHDPLLITLHL